MPNNALEMKTIDSLNTYHFVIPAYQRGYRWKPRQVEDLLNDIWEFSKKPDKKDGDFYCLQPIVVKEKESDTYEVIDGQQRLTTIFLILQCLNQDKTSKTFSIFYDTKGELQEIIGNEGDTIDNFHITTARQTIQNWFCKQCEPEDKHKPDGDCKKIFRTALREQTQVIWYEPEEIQGNNDQQNKIDLFSRLNRGKIPLTNSELIRALFIISTKDLPPEELNAYKIASEWDWIEQQLHNDDLWQWMMLGNKFKKDYPNRIEFLFDLIEEQDQGKANTDDQYSTFIMYNDWIQNKRVKKDDSAGKDQKKKGALVAEKWQEIKNLFYRFHEWHIDDELYHLVGFVLMKGIMGLNDKGEEKGLLYLGNSQKQSDLKRQLKQKLQEHFQSILKHKTLSELNFHEPNEKNSIQSILTFFAIHTDSKEGRRFNFRKFKFNSERKERIWSLEHINAQNQRELPEDQWRKWANNFNNDALKEILLKEDACCFEDLKQNFEKKLIELQGSVKEHEHTIANLALLEKTDNSSLSNCIFSEKRKKIIDFSQDDKHYIPTATKNVFTKQYASSGANIDLLKWDVPDCIDYHNAIAVTLGNYLGVKIAPIKPTTDTKESGDEQHSNRTRQ